MRKLPFIILIPAFMLLFSCGTDNRRTLVWSDEFNDASIDPAKWRYDIGSGFGNGELEFYTSPDQTGSRNIGITADGDCTALRITACDSPSYTDPELGTFHYTSARINTKELFSYTHGRIEARIKLPSGRGIWPAFWMVGEAENWPRSGEIDILELIGGTPYPGCDTLSDATVYATLHWADETNTHLQSTPNGTYTLEEGNFCDSYHIFAMEWNSGMVSWEVDGSTYFQETVPSEDYDAFQKPFYIILNIAVGGSWPGPPDETTIFPQTMFVDWVRVYQ
jgi:beta-glucanase (GH16 family)